MELSRVFPFCHISLDTQFSGSFLKKYRNIPFAVGKAVGKLKTVVCLDTFHTDAPAGIPLDQPFQEIRGGIRKLFFVDHQEAEPRIPVNGDVLELPSHPLECVGWNMPSAGMVSKIGFFLLFLWKHTQFAHHTE